MSEAKGMGKAEAREGEPQVPHSFWPFFFFQLFLKKLNPFFSIASAKIPLFLRPVGAGLVTDLTLASLGFFSLVWNCPRGWSHLNV